MEEPETPVQSVIVSGDDPSVREVVLDEKINLMEAEDEAGERITKSQPKIVLMDVGSATWSLVCLFLQKSHDLR